MFINSNNDIVLGGRTVPDDSLDTVMRIAARDSDDGTLVLKADRTVQHGTVIRVMDAAKRAGMHCIAVTNTHSKDRLAEADLIVDTLAELTVDDLGELIDSD